MSALVYSRVCRSGLVLAVGAAMMLPCGRSAGQQQGSRPIEFSDPKDPSALATNDHEFGSERRRLTDLEDRLSKVFRFFDAEDSMSGAPALRMPRRAPTVVRQQRAKPSGLFEDEERWTSTESLAKLRDLFEANAEADSETDSAAESELA